MSYEIVFAALIIGSIMMFLLMIDGYHDDDF